MSYSIRLSTHWYLLSDKTMIRTYTDFISDITTNSELLRELDTVLPFVGTNALKSWFSSKGYSLTEGDVSMLYQNQNSLMNSNEQINY